MTGGFHAIIGGGFEIRTSGGFHQNMHGHRLLKNQVKAFKSVLAVVIYQNVFF
jgi:hypothetical protein